jgi:hypothetical protein
MDRETARLVQFRIRMYSDEGTLLGTLGAMPPRFVRALAASLLRWN